MYKRQLLTDTKGKRVLAFGKWAGVVGAYNAVRAWQATELSLIHISEPTRPY